MADPFERVVAKAPPVIGSGCTQRYDPEALSPEQGTEFAGAVELWAQLRLEQAPCDSGNTEDGESEPEQ
ncbi:hypothetical protein [Stutzerimonas stutzeri]|uniref:hypothetical protein n=1 Tax=Stutzerimonas stutzeri TaxID=316 RepID=UPI00190B0C40|nr:hypothetical protein [Stutzerimonas stutzeri]MBK3849973.1 hypothetical protein [Stutzerimonas stutzeri]